MKLSSINMKNTISSIKFLLFIPIAVGLRKKHKNLWIITERPDQARDNGYIFYKYLKENHPEGCEVYYVIEQNAEDVNKISPYGEFIPFDSWKHYLYYCVSKVHISAHVGGCIPSNSPICRRLKKILRIRDVFLPHGVSYGVSEFCLQKYAKIDLFITSGKPEYKNVLNNYGYSKDEVAYTGFPRLDIWHHIAVNPTQILLMPTWRLYLAQDPDTIIEETTYYQAYQDLINDSGLDIWLQKNGLTLIFYLHHGMQKYVNSFSTKSQMITIVRDESKFDIQELLKSSALLITDYSSVHFDFAYMNKPVLYYQFDQKTFFEKQWEHSFFDAETMGFGPVVYEKEELLKYLYDAYKKNFTVEEEYHKHMRDFYTIYDVQNCERVYQEIRKRFKEI